MGQDPSGNFYHIGTFIGAALQGHQSPIFFSTLGSLCCVQQDVVLCFRISLAALGTDLHGQQFPSL